MIKQNQSFFDIDNNISDRIDKGEIKGVLVESVNNIDEKINLKD